MLFNIASLVLGIGAWILAVLAIITPKADTSHRNIALSFSSCVLALVFQLFEINRRVIIGDYAAIEDTIRAVVIAAVVLSVVTVVLNIVAWVKAKRR